jgi:hypothetical protein
LYHQVFLKTTKFLSALAQDDAVWLAKSSALREKLIAVGLVEPEPIPEKVIIPTLDAFLDGYIERHGKKLGTVPRQETGDSPHAIGLGFPRPKGAK